VIRMSLSGFFQPQYLYNIWILIYAPEDKSLRKIPPLLSRGRNAEEISRVANEFLIDH
jgi:hypothetical protein